ncbi:MAG: flavin reductase family protein [Pirellulales bacterium]|nr:flavin reductase family protein [Pirellulales bacterium]
MPIPSPSPRLATEHALQLVNREIWIVTAQAGARRGGLVATWISQASIDPERPVMVAGIAPNHYTAELIDAAGGFGLHLLSAAQTALALNFAIGSGRERDKLANLEVLPSGGAPIIRDCLAWLECRVINRYQTGDRNYYWADVLAAGRSLAARDANVQTLRERDLICAATPEQRQALQRNLHADIELQRTFVERWRENIQAEQSTAAGR